ncbi:NEW3 domain-containing protein [Corynebacterium bovis]|uniref:DUF7507 domain-containing protein n=1 Tax=Corynebacterium bovis TaxID=36808 RepID=UPI003138F510
MGFAATLAAGTATPANAEGYRAPGATQTVRDSVPDQQRDPNITTRAAGDDSPDGAGEGAIPAQYRDAGGGYPANTATIRVTARAFSDAPWREPWINDAAASQDTRFTQGIRFELWTADRNENQAIANGPGQRVNADWASCVTGDQGTCDIVVPLSNLGQRYFVKQTNDVAGAYHTDSITWARYQRAEDRTTAYIPGYTPVLERGRVYGSPWTEDDIKQQSFGAAPQSLANPPVERARSCYPTGPRIALVLDSTTSIQDSGQAETLRNAVYGPNGLLQNLRGTGAQIASFTFSQTSPGGNPRRNYPQPLNIDERFDEITGRIRDNQLRTFEAWTNWEDGLRAVYEANQQYRYNEVIFITDGDPNRWGDGNVNSGPDGSKRGVEAGIYRANLIKQMGTRIVTIGAGYANAYANWDGANNLKAISGPIDGLDYFATSWESLAQSLKTAGNQVTCQSELNVRKVIVDKDGILARDQSDAKDWAVDVTVDNLAGTVDNGRGENPANLPLAALSPNNDTADDGANPVTLKDRKTTTGDENRIRWFLSYYARRAEDAHGDITLKENVNSKKNYQFLPGKIVNGRRVGSYYRILDRATKDQIGDEILMTSATQKIPDVRRGQIVEAVYANYPVADFSVSKTAAAENVVANGDGSFEAEFTVTVQNTGRAAGTSPEVLDEPDNTSVLKSSAVTVDGKPAAKKGDRYVVSPGVQLEAGQKKSFTVKVRGTVPAENIKQKTVFTCEDGGQTGGMRNSVVMANDSGGSGDNAACVTVTPPPPGQPTVDKRFESAQRNADGTHTVNYTITVRGEEGRRGWYTLRDEPAFPEKAELKSWKVVAGDNTPAVEPAVDGPYTAPGVIVGTDRAIDAGATHTYKVQFIVGGLDAVSAENAQCQPGDGANGHGLFNAAHLTADGKDATAEGCGPVPPKPGELRVKKKIENNDADKAPGVTVKPGADMKVTYEVENIGGSPVLDVTVTDKIVSENNAEVKNITTATPEKAKKLNPGEKVTFTATIKAPTKAGAVHHDSAQAHGKPPSPTDPNNPDPNAPPVNSPEDPGYAFTEPDDKLIVSKKINGDEADTSPGTTVEPGDDMQVTYEVTNAGSRPMYDITVTDKIVSENNAEVKNITTATPEKAKKLNPGETVTFTATIKAPKAAGAVHHDSAQAHGKPPSPTDPNNPDPNAPPVNSPENPGYAHTPGAPTIQKEFVSATRNSDDTYTAKYRITVTGDKNVDSTYTLSDEPSFADQVAIKSWKVTAGKDTPAVEPPIDGPFEEPGVIVGTERPIAKGATHIYEIEFLLDGVAKVSPKDLECTTEEREGYAGLRNEAHMTSNGRYITSETCNPVPPTDGLKLVKKINGNDANTAPGAEVEPGSDMNVTYEVTNTGNRPIFNVNVTDRIESENNAEVKGITPENVERLNPGETVTFTATIKAPAVGGVQHVDRATAHGVPPSPTDPSKPGDPNDPSTPPVDSPGDPGYARTTPKDGLKVSKKINGDDADTAPGVEVKPGSDMKITYEVENTGERPLFNVSVVDRIATDGNAEVKGISPESVEKLEPDAKVTFTATVKAPEGDNKWHADFARAYGVPPSPTDPSKPGDPRDPKTPPVNSPEDPGNAHTPPPAEPPAPPKRGLKVAKKINGDDANVVPGVEVKPGSDMKVTYEVTNTGDQVLNDVRVVDRIVTESDAPVKGITPEKVDSLKPGETVVFTATIKAPETSATVHHDAAKAIGVPPSGGNKPPSGGVTPPPGGQTPPTGEVTPPPSGETPPPTGEVTPPPSGQTPPPTGEVTPPPSGQTPPPTGEVTPPPSGQTPPPTGEVTPPPGDKTPPPPVIPIIPIIPILPPLPPLPPVPQVPTPPVPPAPNPPVPPAPNPPAPQVPAPPAPNAPVPPAPAPQAPTPPAPENNRGGALAKTGVSAGLGYALLAGLVLLAAGAVMFVLGRRRRSEGGDR